jgi:large subunit ribosomal protein L4e
MARGHSGERVPEVPLVVSNELESLHKTKKAVEALRRVGAYSDVEKVKSSRTLRAGRGKARNRRYVQRKGPLVIYNNDKGIVKAMRNIPGVETCCVTRLNLLQLAPGGHLGRFCVWTKGAMERLDSLYGTQKSMAQEKHHYHLPRAVMSNPDVLRVIHSDEVQAVVRPVGQKMIVERKKNPLKNKGVMHRLNPYYKIGLKLRKAAAEKKTSKPDNKQKEALKRLRKRIDKTKKRQRQQFAQ